LKYVWRWYLKLNWCNEFISKEFPTSFLKLLLTSFLIKWEHNITSKGLCIQKWMSHFINIVFFLHYTFYNQNNLIWKFHIYTKNIFSHGKNIKYTNDLQFKMLYLTICHKVHLLGIKTLACDKYLPLPLKV